MTNDIYQATTGEQKPLSFGARLKSARETTGLDRKDAASQLRLNESMIVMMENENYPSDLPITFIRGYIRNYSKLLEIPEAEVAKALEPLQQKPMFQDITPVSASMKSEPVTSSNYFMQFFTFAIVVTLVGLVGTWWHTHSNQSNNSYTESQPLASPPSNNSLPIAPPLAVNTNANAMATAPVSTDETKAPAPVSAPTPIGEAPTHAQTNTETDSSDATNDQTDTTQHKLSQNKPAVDPYSSDADTQDTSSDNAAD
jgi:cytoskeleton protein RodZ